MGMAVGIGGLISVPPAAIRGHGAPPASFKGILGQMYFDQDTTPPTEYVYNGQTWAAGGDSPATTTTYGSVLLFETDTFVGADDTTVPTSLTVKTYVDATASFGAPLADTVTIGITELSTDAEAVAGTSLLPATPLAVQPSNLAAVFSAPPATGFGNVTPRPVAATTLSATGAFSLTGDTVAVAEGGTAIASYTAGDMITATGATTLSKLAIGTARQVLQTNAGGTAPEWASNLDLPGTLDVTGNVTFDADLAVAGNATVTGSITFGQLNVDNIRIDGNTISSTDVNGDVNITPNGTGKVVITEDFVVDTNVFVVDGTTNNNVGIGTATPAAADKLHVTQSTAATAMIAEFENTNADVASHSEVLIQTSGATGGDPKLVLDVSAVTQYAIGIDNSNSDILCISTGTAPGTTDNIQITSAGAISILRGNADITRSATGNVSMTVANSSVGAGTDNSLVSVTSGGAAGGDAQVNLEITGAGSFHIGIDNSDSDKLKIGDGTAVGTTDSLVIANGGAVSVIQGNFDVSRSATGDVSATIANSSVGAGTDNALVTISSGGAAGGDAQLNFTITGANSHYIGIDNSDSDALEIGLGTAVGTTANVKIGTAGDVSILRGDLDITRSMTGNVIGTISNTSVGAGTDNAVAQITSGGAAGGDAQINFTVTGATSHYIGIDNSDSDSLKIGLGTAVGTTTAVKMDTTGEVTFPLQPSFLAYLAATVVDKTGNGASYTLGTDALTEVYDRNADFNTNGTFTAPITGIYDLRAQVTVTGTTIATGFVISIVTTARTYTYTFNKAAGSQDESVSISCLADMTAADTATVTIVVSGEAGNTDDIKGGAALETYFCGTLVA